MHRLEGAPCGTVAVTKKAGQQVCRVSRAGWHRCSYPAITSEMGVGGTKWGARTALPAGSARESGAETAAAPSVKKKECTGFPFLCVPSVLLKFEDPYQYLSILRCFPLSPQSLQNLPNVLPQRPSLFALNFEPVFGLFTRLSDISEVALIQVLVHLPDSQLPLGKGCTQ